MNAFMSTPDEVEAGESVSVVLPPARTRISWLLSAVVATSLALLTQSGHFKSVHDLLHSVSILWLILAMLFVFYAFSRHILKVSPADLTLTVRSLGLRWTKRYPLNEVSNLRVGAQRIFIYRPWLAFDRRGKTRFLGPQLTRTVPRQLLQPVYARFPQLAPEGEQADRLLYQDTSVREHG